jgi:DNA-3-methyladenine glycosylase II
MTKSLIKSAVEMLTADPVMKKLVESHDPPRIGKNPIFFSLVRAVISQQLSEAAASTIFKRLSAIAAISPDTLSTLDVDTFRTCGISSQKARYIIGLADASLSGQLENIDNLNDEDAIKALVTLKGVGRWTAEMILIFSLGREDVWPCDDAGLLRVAKKLYGLQDVAGFITLGERFKPYRTHAAWYLWASLDKSS